MIWEQNVSLIVMITDLVERNRVKADAYWPFTVGEVCKFGNMSVKLIKEWQHSEDFKVRHFKFWQESSDLSKYEPIVTPTSTPREEEEYQGLDCETGRCPEKEVVEGLVMEEEVEDEDENMEDEDETDGNAFEPSDEDDYDDDEYDDDDDDDDSGPPAGTPSKICVQLHYPHWPDFGVMESFSMMEALIREIDLYKSTLTSPIVVHCSAGIGRTGTLLAILMSLHRQLFGEVIDLKATVQGLREKRLGMVQSTCQYEFIYKIVVSLLNIRDQYCHPAINYLEHHTDSLVGKPGDTKSISSTPPSFIESTLSPNLTPTSISTTIPLAQFSTTTKLKQKSLLSPSLRPSKQASPSLTRSAQTPQTTTTITSSGTTRTRSKIPLTTTTTTTTTISTSTNSTTGSTACTNTITCTSVSSVVPMGSHKLDRVKHDLTSSVTLLRRCKTYDMFRGRSRSWHGSSSGPFWIDQKTLRALRRRSEKILRKMTLF
eukprot:TRINITY_DN6695_c0_g1_i23.p1 TRINITY_DN6695_c0_g1~~TRINITY_DN6695_c0_g1_i23.p1  ORF type:complete len:486 (-),score=107.80 TRINITY_DN6695_c0_g1_i23:249-1706(-)